MMTNWQNLHSEGSSWRKTLVGDISDYYTIPKYIDLFNRYFAEEKGLEVLELGAGNGDLSRRLLENSSGIIKRYVATEHYQEGVNRLSSLGLEARLINAEAIDFENNSFDLVCSFDVMHHVANPGKMAQEMARVSRKYVFLTEANGLSLGRRLFERKPLYRQAGEKSYMPKRYKSFFEQFRFKRFSIEPFLFVFKTPQSLRQYVVGLSEAMQRLPILRWQCATLLIFGEKH